MYSGGGDEVKQNALFATMGATPEMWDELRKSADVMIYPCNWLTVSVFMALQTQWRTGMSGATGLDYAALPAVFDVLGIAKKARKRVFDGIRVMESAVLNLWAERRDA